MERFSVSFDVSVKCTKHSAIGLMTHNLRDVVDREREAAGKKLLEHSNDNIDSDMTQLNESMIYDYDTKQFVKCNSMQDAIDAHYNRLEQVTKTKINDKSVVIRGIVLQMDPEWYEEHTDPKEHKKAHDAMIDWAVDKFGAENLIYISIHYDEMHPHIHIGFMPVTPDGHLAQKHFFPSPQDLREKHQDLREYLTDCGYDICMSNKKPGKYARRMSESEYRDFAELKEQNELLDKRFAHYDESTKQLFDMQDALDKREAQFKAEVDSKAQQLNKWTDLIKDSMKELLDYKAAADKAKEQAVGLLKNTADLCHEVVKGAEAKRNYIINNALDITDEYVKSYNRSSNNELDDIDDTVDDTVNSYFDDMNDRNTVITNAITQLCEDAGIDPVTCEFIRPTGATVGIEYPKL